MMRSLYSAVSGLKTHQTRMDVIGNNIANVNTEAFKSSRVTFTEIMYQTTSSASAGNGATGVGGINPKQIGLGVTTGATYLSITTAGAAETTGNPFDLKLTDSQSTNFFIVSDGVNNLFTRAGSFYVDGNGYMCMSSTGYTLMGWQLDPTTGDIKKDVVTPLQVMAPKNQTSSPEATTKAYMAGILDKNDSNVTSEEGYAMTLQFYDDLGYSYTAKFAAKPKLPTDDPANAGIYTIALTGIIDAQGNDIIAQANSGHNANAPISLDDLFSTNVEAVDENGNFLDADGNVLTLKESTNYYYYTHDGLKILSTPVYATNGTGELLDANNNILTLQAPASVYYYTDANGNKVLSEPAYQTNDAGNYVDADGNELKYDATGDFYYYEVLDADGNVTDTVPSERVMVVENGYVVDADGNPLTTEDLDEFYTYTDANGNLVISEPVIVPNANGEVVDANGNVLTYMEESDLYTYTMTDADGVQYTVVSEPVKLTNELVFDTNEGTFVSIGGAGNDTAILRMSQILSGTVDPETGRTSNFEDIEIDFTSCLNYENGGTSTMKALKGDIEGDGTGKKLGALTGIAVDSDGKIYGTYDNGNTVLLAQIAVTQFANASGLEKVGDNCYQTTLNSGDFNGIGVEIKADGSSISTGQLEMSNVDLSAQFTDMIITQRGFQANSRVITTSDTLLEELINLKR